MYLLLIGLIVLAALLMCFVVLIQEFKKEVAWLLVLLLLIRLWVFARLRILLKN